MKQLNVGDTFYYVEEKDKYTKIAYGTILNEHTFKAEYVEYFIDSIEVRLQGFFSSKIKLPVKEEQIIKAKTLGCTLFTDKYVSKYNDLTGDKYVHYKDYRINGYFKEKQVLNLIDHYDELSNEIWKHPYMAICTKSMVEKHDYKGNALAIPNSNFYLVDTYYYYMMR